MIKIRNLRLLQREQQRGFSLIELAVVLVVSGLLAWIVWRIAPLQRLQRSQMSVQEQLQEARLSLEGFIRSQHRLPCIDVNGDGREDCGASQVVGTLPFLTLEMSVPSTMQYGVHRKADAAPWFDADLASAIDKDRFAPIIVNETVQNMNGLDFCIGLKNAINGAPYVLVGGAAVAYVLVHPGENQSFEQNIPNQIQTSAGNTQAKFDDQILSASSAQLFASLECHQKLTQVQSMMFAARAAHDIQRYNQTYFNFRQFIVQDRQTDLEFAQANMVMASFDLVDSVASVVSGIGISVMTGSIGISKLASGTAALAVAIGVVVKSAVSIAMAESSLETANELEDDASARFGIALNAYAQQVIQAKLMEAKGLQP
jgi:prepilin-type N-terminal cleavage/methylation domain-containing protein